MLSHIFKSRDNWMSPAKIALYAKAEVASCDGLDGLKDGIIGNIEACNYVPTDLLCQGADNDRCLTAGQIESIRLIYSDHKTPVTLSRGAVGYPRYGRGGASTSDWQSYMFGTSFDTPDSFNHMAVTEAARLVEGNPNANILTHDPTRYQAQYSRLAEMIDGTDPNIAAFADNGGKLADLVRPGRHLRVAVPHGGILRHGEAAPGRQQGAGLCAHGHLALQRA